MTRNKPVAWFLALIAPALVWSGYVYVSRMIRSFSDVTDYSALAVSLAIGIAGVLMLARTPGSRVAASAAYVILAGATMYLGMVFSLCSVGDCP